MGNKQSCCLSLSSNGNRDRPNSNSRNNSGSSNSNNVGSKKKKDKNPAEKYRYEPPDGAHSTTLSAESPGSMASCSNLQHISEREPEDADGDPSIHPTTGTIFLTRSKSEIHRNSKIRRRSQYDNHGRSHHYEESFLTKKFSSCSTIFLDDSTVSQPNLKCSIRAVSLAIYFHIRNRDHREPGQLEGRLLDIFNERLHPLTKDGAVQDEARDPEHRSIYQFIRMLFKAAQLTAECAIVTLVYLERLLMYADIEIVPVNWRRIVLGAILLASKVWDDQAVWNVDFCQIMKDITVEDMNELERQFLEMLQFNINVPSSVYAKYYFDLRALAGDHSLSFPLQPLSKERATKLEAMSNIYEGRLRLSTTVQRAHSLDSVKPSLSSSKAILS